MKDNELKLTIEVIIVFLSLFISSVSISQAYIIYTQNKTKLTKLFILLLCGHCKNIRGEDGKWYPVEKYFVEETQDKLTHGICPICTEKYFSDILESD